MNTQSMTLEQEVWYLSLRPSDQRRIYLQEVEHVRGKDVADQMKQEICRLWKSFR